jgi:hypothetical protein
VVLVCLSQRSISKDGFVNKEIKFALDMADEKVSGTIFIIPVRLEEVEPPERLKRWQWVNLFEEGGYQKLHRALALRSTSLGTLEVIQNDGIAAKRPAPFELAPFEGFHDSFREVVAAQILSETGAILHLVFGSIAAIREIPIAIPVGQAFDFGQRGPRSVLASLESIRIEKRSFFEEIERLWPANKRPKAAGLGHTKYLLLPENSQSLPGVFFVVTTRDLSTSADQYGYYANTPIEGIDYIIDSLIEAAKRHGVTSLAMPLLGTGYANVRRTLDQAKLAGLLRQTVTLIAIEKLQTALRDDSSVLRRAVITIFSAQPQGAEEHELWESVTRFLGGRPEQRSQQLENLLNTVRELCK